MIENEKLMLKIKNTISSKAKDLAKKGIKRQEINAYTTMIERKVGYNAVEFEKALNDYYQRMMDSQN